jgi:uncharacterized protein
MNLCRRIAVIIILALCFLPCAVAQKLPRPTGYVNDFAGVMTAEDKKTVNNLATAIQEKTGAEMAVVTVESYAPYASIDDYSYALATDWGIGEKGKDTGVLLILAMEERKVKIEVGYGLEGAIPDSVAGRILDNSVIPAFRENNFSGGLREGSRAIAAYIAKEKGITIEGHDLPNAEDSPLDIAEIVKILLIIAFIILLYIIPLLSKSRRGGGGYRSGSFGGGGGFSSSGRGFGGFGGGSFGGGGASRGF